SNTNTVTVTARTQGTGGNSITLGKTLTGFAWTASPMAGGSNGSNTGSNFAFWSGSTAVSTTVLATNLAAAITRNVGSVGIGDTSATNVVTVTASSTGAAGNNITLTESMPGFTWASPSL